MKKLNLLFSKVENALLMGRFRTKLNSIRSGMNTEPDRLVLNNFKRMTFLSVIFMSLVASSYAQNTVLITPVTPLPAGAGTNLPISFSTGVTSPATDGVLTVYYQGDFDGTGGNLENADIFDENGLLLGFTPPSTQQCFANFDSVSFVIPVATLASWAADQVIDFDFTPTANVNPTLCGNTGDNVIFKLEYTPLTGPDDAGISSVDSPYVFCAGTNNAIVTIRNSGTNQLDSVRVNWELNGVAQPTIFYTSLLDTLGGAFSSSATINLGSAVFNAGVNTLKAWTSMPNGVADTSNLNDTLTVSLISAAAPTSVVLSNVTLNSIDVNAVGGAGTIDYEYGPVGFAPGTGTTGTSATPSFTIGGLSQGTTYDVYVRSNCGAGDVSAYVGPETFNTSYGVPFIQDYENFAAGIIQNPYPEGWSSNGTAANPRWESETGTGANNNSFGTGPLWDNTNYQSSPGIYMYMETSGGTVGDSVDLISPPIFVDPVLSTVELSYAYFMFGTNIDRMQVIVDTNGVETVLVTYTGQQQALQTDRWALASHLLTGYAGKSVTIKFRGWNVSCCSGDIAVDDIRIDPVLPLNVGVVEVQSPSGNLCPGPVTPVLGVKNFGSNIVDSVNVVWNINGVLDSVMYIGTIFPGDTASVPLATLNINSTTIYDLEFYTNRPNGAADQFTADDTLNIQGLRTGLSGVFTLDATQPASATNLTSFAQLGQVLSTYGMCGATTVNVAAGTYNDILLLDNIVGSSATDRLTIDGGDSATTVLENSLANDNAVIEMKSASYVTIKNLTVRSTRTNTTLHSGIHLSNGADFDSLVNVRVTVNPNATFNVFGVMATLNSTTNFGNGNHANNFVMMNSSVHGGDWNVLFRGNGGGFPGPASSNGWNMNNQFINNTFTGADDYGLYTDDQDGLQVIGNTVTGLRTTSTFAGYGIVAFDGMNFKISANNLVVPYTGIYVTNANSTASGTRRGFSEVSNNMVSCNVNSGIWLQRPVKVNIWNNSVYCGSTAGLDAALYLDDGFGTPAIDSLDVRNNTLYGAGKAFKIDEPDSVFTKFDNNAFYTLGTDLLDIDGALYADLITYQTAQPSYNAASLEGDPQFVSLTDLHVVGSFINGGGDISVPITVDIDGDTRPLPGSTAVDIGADEFNPPLCPPSVNLGATNITLTTADIFWTGITMDYQYEVVPAGAPQGSGTVVRTPLDTVNITGLTPSTSYDFYVREICGRGDTSIWIGPFTFGTSNGVPFVEDFETFSVPTSGNPWPKGWSSTTTANPKWESETGTGVNVNSFNTGPFYDNTTFGTSGGTYIYLETSGGAGNTADFRSPGIFVDPTQASLTLEVAVHMFGATMGNLEVLVDSNGVENSLFTITGQQQTAQADPYILRTANIAGYQGKSINIIFRGTSGTSFTSDIAIDDVRIFEPSPADASVTDIISPTSGCGLGNDSVTVEISNVGTAIIFNFPVAYTLNGGAPVVGTYVDTLQPGAVANYTFNTTVNLSTFGSYNLVSYTNLAGDGDVTNDTSDVIINSIPLVGSIPYIEDFETSNGGWTAYGNANSWAWGTPAGAVISSAAGGTGAWVTNLTGTHNNSESSFIESPCLDLSSLTVDPILSFSLTYDTESCCDEGWVEYSTDGGATWTKLINNGAALQWYNDLGNQWWDGTSSGGAGVWVNAENVLVGLAGQSSVKIRFAFSSDGSVIREGFGIDNVRIDLPSAIDAGVSDLISPVTGCGLSGSDSVRVRVKNFGADTLTSTPVSFELNGAAAVTETITTQILPGDSLDYTFTTSLVNLSVPGNYNFKVYTGAVGDGNPTNDTLREIVSSIPIGTFPYTEDFETSNGGWTTSGAASTWAWGTPAGSVIASAAGGTGAWVTNLTGAYNNSEFSYLESPCFDLSGQTSDPVLRFSLTYETESCCDEGWVEVSTDGGVTWNKSIDLGAAQNWYNDLGNQWWDGNNASGAGIWDTTSNVLTGTAGFSSVKFRFAFSSDGSVVREGFGVDNVSLDVLTSVENINDAAALEFSLYPNPTVGVFNLIAPESKEAINVEIFDTKGQIVYEEVLSANSTRANLIDLSSSAKGVYFVKISDSNVSRVEKLIIQ